MEDRSRMIEVSSADLYHRLGKLEGLIELNSQALLATQNNLQALTAALGSLQSKQSTLEGSIGSHRSSTSGVVDVFRSFIVPLLAIVVTYGLATRQPSNVECNPSLTPRQSESVQQSGNK
jgi:hypothetical protein